MLAKRERASVTARRWRAVALPAFDFRVEAANGEAENPRFVGCRARHPALLRFRVAPDLSHSGLICCSQVRRCLTPSGAGPEPLQKKSVGRISSAGALFVFLYPVCAGTTHTAPQPPAPSPASLRQYQAAGNGNAR